MLRFAALFLALTATTCSTAFVVPSAPIHQPTRSQDVSMKALDQLAALGLTDTQVIEAGVVGLAAVIAGGFAMNSQGLEAPAEAVEEAEPEPEPEPIDVSIPYDAAAKMAFEAWLNGADYDEATYQKFKPLYEAKASAEVAVSRYARELAALAPPAPSTE